MKYYEIQTKPSEFYKKKLMNNNSVTANKMSLEQRQFVGKLSNGYFLDNVPELSPFSMMGYGNITTWERFRFDVHNFIASGSGILGFFISVSVAGVPTRQNASATQVSDYQLIIYKINWCVADASRLVRTPSRGDRVVLPAKEGGDIARWGFQAVLYLVQVLITFLFHRDRNKRNLKPSFIGATIAFIIVF